MGRIEELLRKKRETQIRRMNGEDVDSSDIDAALKKLSKKRQPKTSKRVQSRYRILFSRHARTRMAQRGMHPRVIYAIWRACTPRKQDAQRTIYMVTRKDINEATTNDARLLEPWIGCAIIIADDGQEGATLVTVLAAGEDTRIRERHGKY